MWRNAVLMVKYSMKIISAYQGVSPKSIFLSLFFYNLKFIYSNNNSETGMLLDPGLEVENGTIMFVNNFFPDYMDYHPRLEDCLGLYPLKEDEEWYILKDGSLYHSFHSSNISLYCLENALVSKIFSISIKIRLNVFLGFRECCDHKSTKMC